ncbi:chemotaxis protein [Malaciobacter mytili]|uniref:Chemotaxis protein n=1 Tax=Malaciobacter mytili LMG 24559 TaxID=1032238 RepID=A0AAX2AI48_9BACT|nr:methyl-accepting chemotaxis protein [Malaciobacter mytili]AXH14673.1 MCP-domain signal transduction protein [Malaciobacter mytili LMG 24559]RXI43273.1 chemotaxis protein [Malaciobacter mytili]RXK16225.1 chemotaxis protein [Malaciobacter mytili LMG 24559]
MKNLSVKLKLAISTIIAVVGFVVITSLMFIAISNISNLNKASQYIETLQANMLKLRINEKNFLNSLDISYAKELFEDYQVLNSNTKNLKELLSSYSISTTQIDGFLASLDKYSTTFEKVVEKQKEIGFNHKDGLYGSLRQSVHKVQEIGDKVAYQAMNVGLLELRRDEKDFMLRKDISYVDKFEKNIRKLRFIVRSNKTHISNEQKEEIYTSLKKYREDFLALVKAEEIKGFSNNLGLLKQMKDIASLSEKILKDAVKEISLESENKVYKLKILAFILAASMTILCLTVSYFIASQVVSNINKFHKGLVEFFNFINGKTHEVKLIQINSKDEFGSMTKIINENIENTKINIQKESELIHDATYVANMIKQGHLSNKISVTSNNETLNELKDVINEMLENMRQNILTIMEVLGSYRNYDYTKFVDSSLMQGSMKRLAQDVNSVGQTITEMLKDSRKTGVYLENDSNSLTKYVKILSQISNEQAASLEETAAAIEEITSNIENTTMKTIQMSNISKETKQAASMGKIMASKTVSSMEEINETVEAIKEAIIVIDQIAFQTNILSLNAAVEAATAGEAGRGFAVVAQEVRNLASRSAQAASEIKNLVENATLKANEGKSISIEMIQGFEKLDTKINDTTNLVEEVSRTSKEQNEVMSQINSTMGQLDKNTQENAKTAENTRIIAEKTNKLAIKALNATDDKKFEGKEEIVAKNKY